MTLEFEKLTESLAKMGEEAKSFQERQRLAIEAARQKLTDYGREWGEIARCLRVIGDKAPATRLARPLHEDVPLNAGIPLPAATPAAATLFAADGSQIYPDRHADYLYYLLNVGCIIYHHSSGQTPEQSSYPTLHFGEDDLFMNDQIVSGSIVSARRDLQEIEQLADLVFHNRHNAAPLLAVLDQRLLYWPFWSPSADSDERNAIVRGWQEAMTKIRHSGALLAGFIEASRRNSVVHLLSLLNRDAAIFDEFIAQQEGWINLTDSDLYEKLLAPGERSPIFVDVSEDNDKYEENDPFNEVCFFYLNVAPRASQREKMARVDIPRWVANDPQAVAATHALLYDQCLILDGYPYVLARADEAAVVGKQDAADLNGWIALEMDRQRISGTKTSKQDAKDLARSGKKRHGLY